jgi:hypothetical protein
MNYEQKPIHTPEELIALVAEPENYYPSTEEYMKFLSGVGEQALNWTAEQRAKLFFAYRTRLLDKESSLVEDQNSAIVLLVDLADRAVGGSGNYPESLLLDKAAVDGLKNILSNLLEEREFLIKKIQGVEVLSEDIDAAAVVVQNLFRQIGVIDMKIEEAIGNLEFLLSPVKTTLDKGGDGSGKKKARPSVSEKTVNTEVVEGEEITKESQPKKFTADVINETLRKSSEGLSIPWLIIEELVNRINDDGSLRSFFDDLKDVSDLERGKIINNPEVMDAVTKRAAKKIDKLLTFFSYRRYVDELSKFGFNTNSINKSKEVKEAILNIAVNILSSVSFRAFERFLKEALEFGLIDDLTALSNEKLLVNEVDKEGRRLLSLGLRSQAINFLSDFKKYGVDIPIV